MKVKALARGVYGPFYEPGDVFEILDDEHLGSWMEPVDAEDRKRLADRITRLSKDRRVPAGPDVPLTTAKASGVERIPMPKKSAKAQPKA